MVPLSFILHPRLSSRRGVIWPSFPSPLPIGIALLVAEVLVVDAAYSPPPRSSHHFANSYGIIRVRETHPEAGCCMPIPNHHFPTWKISVLSPITFPTALLPFPNPKRIQLPEGRPNGSIMPAASSSAAYSVPWRMHSIATGT